MNERLDLRIGKLVHGGDGLGRTADGRTVFVSGVLPGERVLAQVLRKRKGVLEAACVEVLEPSPDRVAPPCAGELQCTGATWPHIAYPAQLRCKEEILLDALQRTGGMTPRRLQPILPSPVTDHYRLRTQFTVRSEQGRQAVGFLRQGTARLVEVEDAFLLHPLINRTLAAVRSAERLLPRLDELHINASSRSEVHLLLFAIDGPLPPLDPLFASLRTAVPEVVGLTAFLHRKKAAGIGENVLTLDVEGVTLKATEGNFFQVNWEQNRAMVRTVLDYAGLQGGETVLDLYCGIGNFALPLARRAGRVIGIESGWSAIEDARRNGSLNGITNAEFIADDLQKGLKRLMERKLRAGVVVLDPPRAGATLTTLERILAFVPRKIVYVSCNPATLSRDLKFFHLFGFRLDRLQPVDMFPWTYHIEAVAEMVREE